MKTFECNDGNDNIFFLYDLINDLKIDKSKYKWIISDLDLIPIFHGDISGVGGIEKKRIAYEFVKRIEQEKVIVLDSDELYKVLEDTQSIRNGVLICLEKRYSIDVDTYRPTVESNNVEQIYDERAKCEIRILDGDLFFVL